MGNVYWNNDIPETVLDEFWFTGLRMCRRRDKSRRVILVEDMSDEDFRRIAEGKMSSEHDYLDAELK